MNRAFGWLERVSADALETDRYLEALLAASDRDAADGGLPAAADPAIRRVAHRLHETAIRVHPSFRFEERLARRLAGAAALARPRLAVSGGGAVVAFGGGAGAGTDASPDGSGLPAVADGQAVRDGAASAESVPGSGRPLRPLLVGGALTSAAISIAGAALVAWRIARTSAGPGDAPSGTSGAAGATLTATHALLRRLD